MKELPLLLLGCLVAAGTSAAVAVLGNDTAAASPVPADEGAAEERAALVARLGELEAENRTLAERLATLEAGGMAAPARRAVEGVDAAVARWMENHAPGLTGAGAGDAPLEAVLADAVRLDATEIQKLADAALTGDYGEDGYSTWWQRVRESGQLDAVIAEIERAAELDASNPDTQAVLGHAYLQKVFDVGVGPVAMMWSDKANAAYDQALSLDNEHWEARFSKAMSLSNMPAFLGKSGEAIREFETLIDQQEAREPRGEDEQAYLYLGNLYMQSGETEKAMAAWQRGFERFPDSTNLGQQIQRNR